MYQVSMAIVAMPTATGNMNQRLVSIIMIPARNYFDNNLSNLDFLNPTTISSSTKITGVPNCPDFFIISFTLSLSFDTS